MNSILLGELLALIPAITWAENSVAYAYLGRSIKSDAVAHVRLWVAIPLLICLTLLIDKRLPLGYSPTTYFLLLTSGVIGFFITDVMLFWAYTQIGPRQGMVIMTLSPIFSAVFDYLFNGQKLAIAQGLGIGLTLVGIIVMIMGEKTDQDKSKNVKKGYLLAFLASFAQSVSYIIADKALDTVPPVSSNFIRAFGGFIALVLYSIFIRRSFVSDFKAFDTHKTRIVLVLAALLGPCLGMCVQLTAISLAPMAIVTALSQLSPIILLPVDVLLFKKRLTIFSIAGTALSVLGVIIIFLI